MNRCGHKTTAAPFPPNSETGVIIYSGRLCFCNTDNCNEDPDMGSYSDKQYRGYTAEEQEKMKPKDCPKCSSAVDCTCAKTNHTTESSALPQYAVMALISFLILNH